jgi:hypothetical protein
LINSKSRQFGFNGIMIDFLLEFSSNPTTKPAEEIDQNLFGYVIVSHSQINNYMLIMFFCVTINYILKIDYKLALICRTVDVK